MVLRVGSFLPFSVTAYLNGHNYIAQELNRQGVGYVKDDNRFVSTENPAKLQAAADGLSAQVLQQRIDYWTLIVSHRPVWGPTDASDPGQTPECHGTDGPWDACLSHLLAQLLPQTV